MLRSNAYRLLKYGILFSLAWLLLTQGNSGSWVIGIFVVPMAALSACFLLSKYRIDNPVSVQIAGLFQFIPFFLWQSLRGGWDSAMFAVNPEKRVKPAFIRFDTQLPAGRPQLFFAHLVSLLPGTVSVDINKNILLIHALDEDGDHVQALLECEDKVCTLFGLEKN